MDSIMARDTINKLKDVFANTARRNVEAATYRNSGKPEGAEDSRIVYLSSCEAIASNFASLGFRFAKSGPHFSRVEEPFTYQVSFQSSHNNVPGRHVQLWMHATVKSKKLKAWRESRLSASSVNDFVAGGMVHRLRMEHAMVEWELADPKSRPSVIADAVAFVKSDVLPYFAQFSDIGALIDNLSHREIPAFDLCPSVEFAICFGDTESGRRVLERFLRDRPDLSDAIAEVERVGFKHPKHGPSNFAEQVVFLRQTYLL